MSLSFKLNLALILIFLFANLYGQVPSSIIFKDDDGLLRAVKDAEDNNIVDFSHAGYKQGEAPLPEVAVVATVSPIVGDNTAHLQQIIDSVANLSLNADGIRGAILLEAGTYEIHGTLRITVSGVVLRGVGDGEDATTNTILKGIGNQPNQRNIIEAGGLGMADWTAREQSSTAPITSEFVPAGARTLEVGAAELYNAGDEVIIFHNSTSEWLETIDFGDTGTDAPWSPSTINLFYKRTITDVNLGTGKITLDIPVYDHLERALSTAEIYKLAETDIKTNIGIEDLRIDIVTNGELSEDHAKNGIFLRGVEDCWVSGVTALHFIYAAVDMSVASQVTVQNCNGLLPHSLIDGARRYNFAVGAKSNNILFTECHASEGRHSYVSNGTSSVSGIVWHNSTSTGDYSTSEGHRRWSQALLFDNITFTAPNTSRLMGLYSRGSAGTGHGWSAVHSVAWNVSMPVGNSIVLQKPPRRQNYAIGSQAIVFNTNTFSKTLGFEEHTRQELEITSLYDTQLSNRLNNGISVDAPARFEVAEEGGFLNFSWLDIADNETGYVLEISSDGTNFNEFVSLDANETTYSVSTAQIPEGMAYFRLFANSVTYPSAYTHSAIVDFSVSTNELDIDNKVRISPNPTADFLMIASPQTPITQIQVYDTVGRLLLTDYDNQRINVSNLDSGIYILKMKFESGTYQVTKFIKL